ncbi:UCH-domain-containing protein [Periconia macrospinosa]|uniref:Ubiquitin carboxyl-terminal hydrolase n=1 Tax=Periconia macrospinosa TaxID=97972 RepID=A0A2V1DRE1_9PLEO|nr:UCH-domain-containing protein [Periconia macrospinosa]
MMPGPHIPPAGPHHPGRRQADHQYYHMPPQAHSPVHHNPYAAYHHPQHYGPPHASPYPPQMQQHMQQWYNPYHQPHPHQYAMPPRQFQPQPQPHGSPVVVSSHPHMVPMPPPVNRAMGQTPPIVHSRTPPAPQRMPTPHRTPQPAPSTPSIHSQAALVASSSPPANLSTPTPPPPTTPSMSSVVSTPALQPGTYLPFYPNLPWKSFDGDDFPPRASQKKRRRRAPVQAQEQGLALPSREQPIEDKQGAQEAIVDDSEKAQMEEPEDSQASTGAAISEPEVDTPSTSHPPSENDLTHAAAASATESAPVKPSVPVSSHARSQTKPAVPLIPIRSAKPPSVTSATQKSAKSAAAENASPKAGTESAPGASDGVPETPKVPAAPKAAPSSWAALLRKNAPAPAPAAPATNGIVSPTNGPPAPISNSLGDVLASFSVESDKKLSFLEPRGLVNTGNLCYMNSILQMLVFCVPFYDFLDQVAKRAVHSFKSETPLVDAMIMFMRDFKVIDSATSSEQLRLRLKDNELEQYGEPLTPEYVYDVIKRLPRFDNMKRGQQEDAEEFLGFLLAGLHDECVQVIKSTRSATAAENASSPKSERSGSVEGGWLEVGPKQKSSTTQSSGAIEIESPVTKIFGGKIRSEYRKPGEKPSVTLEPYQPLQLDIGSPEINSIADALKGMTHLETLDSATRGGRASTKQVFIETLPPVLILHLKRFHYDANGPQKIWKKIGYPLELEIPKEAFAPHKRSGLGVRGGPPRYRLTGVVYHHGKNASGGHYTVDLRRQDGREWVRMDDTVIRRIRADEVAEGGAEEDPKVLAAALEQHKNNASKSKNMYEQIGIGEYGEEPDKGGWSKVNGSEKSNSKKWNGLMNGTATPNSAGKQTPLPKENVRDNKVAYILFYERINV